MNESPGEILRARLPLWAVATLLGITLALGAGAGLLGGLMINRPAPACPESEDVCAEFAVFWEAWELARERYVEPEAAAPDSMTAGAVNGMLDTLGDSGHTRFLTAEEAREWDEQLRGSFEGIGAYIDVRDGQTMIVAPIEGSPAEAAGLRAGDQILAVDGESTSGWTVGDLQRAVKGPGGTQVTLTVLHPDAEQPVEITITRAQVVVPSVSWRLLDSGIALIRLASFDDDAGRELRAALGEAQDQGARAVILDMRNNPGGLLDQAVEVASQFLPEGTTVLLEEDREGRQEVTGARRGGVALDVPLVVLVNEGSASSAEIVSGALQVAGRATLVGETTFGTGTVLTPYRLSDGSRLLLGTQEWLTPDGRQIRGQGIVPDERVALPIDVAPMSPAEAAELDAAALRESEDVQLARALELASAAASR
ncbi:MAG TPA: S41 family peptidase [Chloroflexaceae bacterium]|nr:S41 family peptidase [Chloroflexaceae bacterium]